MKPNVRIRRLRWLISGFVLTLLIPTSLLFNHSLNQLKWESAFQNTKLAQDLTKRIDSELYRLLETEEARPFSDYQFLVVSGDKSTNYLRTSALAAFPLDADIPGLMGYFQIDESGSFSSPLLPSQSNIALRYGVSNEQLKQREELSRSLFRILKDNKLAAKSKAKASLSEELSSLNELDSLADSTLSSSARQKVAVQSIATGKDIVNVESVLTGEDALSGGQGDRAQTDLAMFDIVESEDADAYLSDDFASGVAGDAVSESISGPISESSSNANDESYPEPAAERSTAPNAKQYTEKKAESQAKYSASKKFEDLKRRAPSFPESEKRKLGQIRDLPLEQNIELEQYVAQKRAPSSVVEEQKLKKAAKRAGRKEQNLVPEIPLSIPEPTSNAQEDPAGINIALFESDVEPFEFTLLDSGHFILYRRVRHEGKRYFQGSIIEQKSFLEQLIQEPYFESSISEIGKLIVGYQDNVITAMSGGLYNTYLSSRADLGGALLFESSLSTPFNGLQLVFSAEQLSWGEEAQTVFLTAGFFCLILIAGAYGFYRVGVNQIKLTAQQQDFVSSVSHELKTPLTSIRMYGEMLLSGWANEEKKQQYYQYIFDESERLSRLINNILQMAKMTRDELEVVLQPTTVSELLDLVRSRAEGICSAAGFQLNLPRDSEHLHHSIEVDKDAFIQVVLNLIDNAIKFGKECEDKRIDVEVTAEYDKLFFSVRDFGPGVPEKSLKALFGLFYRVESEMTRRTQGTGIGLALVQQLLHEMHADIRVENAHPGLIFKLGFDVVA